MIVESLVNLFLGILRGALSGFEMVGLPLQYINTLNTILVYGNWVVGVDIMALFVGTVVFWWAIKLAVGLIIWLWELLPLT